jgi:hypothetical protein
MTLTFGFVDRVRLLLVLVDDAAEDSSSPYRGVDRNDEAGVVVGRVLATPPGSHP